MSGILSVVSCFPPKYLPEVGMLAQHVLAAPLWSCPFADVYICLCPTSITHYLVPVQYTTERL